MVDIDAFVQSMKNVPDKFVLIDDGYIIFLLGIEITHIDEKIFKASHIFLIDRIIYLLKIYTNDYGMDTQTKSTPVGK